jgi:hypothetical protein
VIIELYVLKLVCGKQLDELFPSLTYVAAMTKSRVTREHSSRFVR